MTLSPSRALVVAAALCGGIPLWGQEPPLEVVLTRTAEYVANFRVELSGIVSEERYEQEGWTPFYGASSQFPRYEREHALLRSDFLLVRLPGVERQIEFRDVFEVDGRPTRDRDERLARLFLDPSASSMAQVRRITIESARYNVGLIYRTLNTPTLALLFVAPEFQERSRFTRIDFSEPSLGLDRAWPRPEDELWVLEFEEVARPTIVTGEDRKNLPARGRFWVDPRDGSVVASELIVKDVKVEATVDVQYRFDAEIGRSVPVEMREFYTGLDGSRVEGTATYSNFRRFIVQVDEALPPDQAEPTPH